ncbi:hypothetical protein EYF80_010760 [Liparis tanakae]|uniref:Uncharacterized protein n=1 Tax=Liparis tanakae TaxID=230148 RepID=A0A4Z2IMR6_9TELE|nr:hypothetical protein EYF80_010760 [Liparis tanakae]
MTIHTASMERSSRPSTPLKRESACGKRLFFAVATREEGGKAASLSSSSAGSLRKERCFPEQEVNKSRNPTRSTPPNGVTGSRRLVFPEEKSVK